MYLPITSGVLGILAFLPYNLYPLGFIFLVPLFIFYLREFRFWRLILGTFIFRLIFSLGVVYYTLEPITWISSIFIFLGLPVAVFAIKKSVYYLAAKYHNGLQKRKRLIAQCSLLILLPFLWTLFDHLEARYSFLPTYIMTAGNALGSSPFLGLANFGGLLTLTFFAALINALIAYAVINFKNTRSCLIAAAIIIVLTLYALQISRYEIQNNSAVYGKLDNSLKIATISTNVNFNQSDLEKVKNDLKDKRIDLAVFPEDIFDSSSPNPNPDYSAWQNLAGGLNINIITTFDTPGGDGKYNTTILINKSGEVMDWYDKNRLTFIGEDWPLGKWHPFFFNWVLKTNPETKNYIVFNPQTRYIKGNKKVLYLNKDSVPFSSLICLEVQYPSDLNEYKKMGVKFIANPTSNRWLNAGTAHFLYLTDNLKKIESAWLKLPIISSGVNEYAGITTPDGKTNLANYGYANKNYKILFGEIRYQ